MLFLKNIKNRVYPALNSKKYGYNKTFLRINIYKKVSCCIIQGFHSAVKRSKCATKSFLYEALGSLFAILGSKFAIQRSSCKAQGLPLATKGSLKKTQTSPCATQGLPKMIFGFLFTTKSKLKNFIMLLFATKGKLCATKGYRETTECFRCGPQSKPFSTKFLIEATEHNSFYPQRFIFNSHLNPNYYE